MGIPPPQETPRKPPRTTQMSATARLDNSHYEQACDQAIAMCDGNLRSTIKALIMANEYLEAELQDMQEAMSAPCPHRHAVRGWRRQRIRRPQSSVHGK